MFVRNLFHEGTNETPKKRHLDSDFRLFQICDTTEPIILQLTSVA